MNTRPILVGRTAELEQIDSLLAGHRPIGPGLLLRGDPGVGKTALLDAAAVRAEAAGMRVLRAPGAEFEAAIRFSALHHLLDPLRERADRLASCHRDVLHQVFDLTPGPAPDRLVVSTAALALLGQVAAERPLLLTIDDVPWIDHASATVLGFVTRRIGNDPIAFLTAARTGVDSFFDQVRLPEREISPLGEQPAATLLDILHPNLAPPVRRRLLDEAAGNPLALRELPGLLTERQRCGQDPLPAFLSLNGRLEAIFAAGVRALPAPTHQTLLLAALEPDASLATIRPAARGRADVDDLAPAQQANLVRIDAVTGPMVFRHPLIRSAIVQTSLPSERRAAHQALAATLAGDPGRRAWHLAEAATGPDETVARVLEEAALAAWRRGRASAAVAALVRAGELSPHPADRSRRLAEAAYLANTSGQLDQVTRLLADAGQAQDTPTGLIFAATAQLLAYGEGDIDAAHHVLARALDARALNDVADTAKTNNDWDGYGILALLFVCVYSNRQEPWELLKTALARLEPEAVSPLRLCYDAYADPARTSHPVREDLAPAFDALPTDAAPWQLIPLAYAALQVDTLSDYRYLCRRMIERERDGGAIYMAVVGLLMLSVDSYVHGQWDEAENLAREGLDLAVAHGYHLLQGQLRCRLALFAAARGNVDLTRALADEIATWAAPRGVELTQALAWHARAIAALGQGDYEDSYVQASRVNPLGTLSLGIPGRWLVLDLVEAAVRTGRTDQARAYVAAAQQAGIARISPRAALLIAGAAALAADDDQAGLLFETALSLPEVDRWPFDHARIQLAYGEWLRRTRDTTRARLHLRAALDTLNRLGARPWAVRAQNELRATGIATTARPDTRSATLTAQERQIATLAATGLTNKQIGQKLFLSHRTVGAHLHRIFPKLGITSRAALRDALEMITSDADEYAPQLPPPPTTRTAHQPSRQRTEHR
ncbi:helix-turn-helix domain-containing protein [Planosporangium thailandense]|uniref:Helix-turn-helix domain-containing protein n=1 Tax=Planosporangium thailandense TaxID=765197 RepID=A0ABX0Y6L5_9ACTN|nr:helix-turn-helix domain-containing protein [Planosporangium thailandense]